MLDERSIKAIMTIPDKVDWEVAGTDENLSQICEYLLECDMEGRPTYREAFEFLSVAGLFTDKFCPYVLIGEADSDSAYWKAHKYPVAHQIARDLAEKIPFEGVTGRIGASYCNGLLVHYAKLGLIDETNETKAQWRGGDMESVLADAEAYKQECLADYRAGKTVACRV